MLSNARRPRVRRWRRTLRALALTGRAREAHPGADDSEILHLGPGPAATALREDRGPLAPARLLRPRQGRLGNCWVMAPMLALHETAPERLRALLTAEGHGIVAVRLPGVATPLRVDRRFPVDEHGVFQYGRRDGANPGWVGALEKAIAAHVAADYAFLQRGFARFGFELLLGERVRSQLRMPSAARIIAWRSEGRAIAASTHPFSGRVPTIAGPLPSNHVFAVVGADAYSGHVHLRNPWRPERLLVIDARSFRRGFLSVDVTGPLR
ncbi:MAG: C2 family cysteine protease [Brachybacterium sp.]